MATRTAPHGFMRSTFLARALPEVIWLRDEPVQGPFCQHCGNPWWMHGLGERCPDRVLHSLFPGPSCTCHGERVTDSDGQEIAVRAWRLFMGERWQIVEIIQRDVHLRRERDGKRIKRTIPWVRNSTKAAP